MSGGGIGQHQFGERFRVDHLCPEATSHQPGVHCEVCLIMPTRPQEPAFVSTERLDRWQIIQDAKIARGGV